MSNFCAKRTSAASPPRRTASTIAATRRSSAGSDVRPRASTRFSARRVPGFDDLQLVFPLALGGSHPQRVHCSYRTILLSGYSTMPWARAVFSFGIRSRTVRSSMIVLTATHSSSLSAEIVGRWSAGSSARTDAEIGAPHVEHQADAALRLDGRLQQQRDVLELVLLPRIRERGLVRDELRVRLHHGVEDAQPVGAERRAGFGHFDDRVGQHRRLDLGRAPRELDVHARRHAGRSRRASHAPARSRPFCPRGPWRS